MSFDCNFGWYGYKNKSPTIVIGSEFICITIFTIWSSSMSIGKEAIGYIGQFMPQIVFAVIEYSFEFKFNTWYTLAIKYSKAALFESKNALTFLFLYSIRPPT